MDQHPIKAFIDQIFSTKPDQKRNLWAQYLIDQEYDTVEDLMGIEEDTWKEISAHIPLKIVGDIKKNLAEKGVVKETGTETPTKTTPKQNKEEEKTQPPAQKQGKDKAPGQNKEEEKTDPDQNPELSSKDIDKICELMNQQFPAEKIVKFLDSKLGTPRGDAIFEKVKLLIAPPKPYPENGKKVIPRSSKDPILPLFLYEGREDTLRKYYTFLVIGETGSGKTTLLDAFVNKLAGIEYTDNWRWKLVDQSHLNGLPNGKSKTSEITIYHVNDHLNKFNIRIIDSPGFGDTAGIKVDDQITKKFETLFTQIPEIDYILLTIKSSQTRLKHGSKYIYDRVQQLFGVDAKDRFILMCTFADDKTPECLAAVGKDIHYERYFTFNNSAIYTPSDKGNNTTKFY